MPAHQPSHSAPHPEVNPFEARTPQLEQQRQPESDHIHLRRTRGSFPQTPTNGHSRLRSSINSSLDHTDRMSDQPVFTPPRYNPRSSSRHNLPTSSPEVRGQPSNPTTPSGKPSVKHLTCWWWFEKGQCRYDEDDCLYAHHDTGMVADAPRQVKPGGMY